MSFLKIEKMDLLIALYIFCVAVSELMGAKTFPVFDWGWVRLNASVAVFVIPLIFTINDVVTEVYGKERARSIIRSSLVVIFLMLLYSLLVTNLPPSKRFASSEGAYDAVFGLSARISAASLVAFILSDFLDVYVFVWLREKFGKGRLWLRNNVSNFISQFIDSGTFLILAFYAFDQSFSSNFSFIMSLLIPYWFLRCALSVLETPLVYLGVKWLKGGSK
jgi:queuosine precursor transporter